MSEKQGYNKKRRNERREKKDERRERRDNIFDTRDPSQSSIVAILEWDPSADIGTRIIPSFSTGRNTNTINNTIGLNTTERIPMDSTARHGSTDNNRPENSLPSQPVKSGKEAPPVKNKKDSYSLRSLSMLELATTRPRKESPHPTSLVNKAVQNQHQNEVSTTGAVSTAVSHKKSGAWENKSHGFETFIPNFKTPPNSTPVNLTKISIHMLPPQDLADNSGRSRQFESDANNDHKSSDENIVENRTNIARGISEASSDWEYGPSSYSQSNKNGVSSISEWQSSALTKSEMIYQSRQSNDSVSTGTFSVQVNLDQDSQEIPGRVRSQYRRSSLDENVGYFDLEMVSPESIQPEVGRRKSTKIFVEKQAQTNPSQVNRSTQTTTSFKNQGLPSNTGENGKNISRHSKHHHKSRHISYIANIENNEIGKTRPSIPSDIRSNLSSTCDLLLNLVQRSDLPTRIDLMSTLKSHRDSHAKKFKVELDHLTELNRILEMSMEPFSDPLSNTSTSTTRTDESSPQDNGYYRKHPHLHVQTHTHSSRNPPLHETKNTTKNPSSRHTKHENDLRYKHRGTQMSKTNVYSPQRHSTEEFTQIPRSPSPSFISARPDAHYNKGSNSKYTQYSTQSPVTSRSRFDRKESFGFLIDKMDILTDLFILNGKIPIQLDDNDEQNKDVLTKKEIKKLTSSEKRAISFYIPFPGCKYKLKPNESESNEEMQQVHSGTALREVYERVHPESVTNILKRELILAQMKTERKNRGEIKRELVRNHPSEDMCGLTKALPPKGQKIMSTLEMKELTRKKYKRLAEMKQKILQRSNNEEKKKNRLTS